MHCPILRRSSSKSILIRPLILLLAGGPFIVQAQVDDSTQLRTIVSLDRSVYFPDEMATITVSAANLSGRTLRVFEPFRALTGCLEPYKVFRNHQMEMIHSHPACGGPYLDEPPPPMPITTFAVSETRVKVLKSNEPRQFDGALPPFHGGVGRQPGIYRLVYSYFGSTPATFQVVTPHFEAAASVRLSQDRLFVDPGTGQSHLYAQYVHVFAARWNGQSFICIAGKPITNPDPARADTDGNLAYFGTHRRIAISQNPIVSINATADFSGNTMITWRDSAGGVHSISGDAPTLPGDFHPLRLWVIPASAKLEGLQTAQFDTIFADSTNSSVIWTVAPGPDAPAGVPTGTITNTGLYTAPAALQSSYTVTVTAQRQDIPSETAFASVNLLAPASPPVFSLTPGTYSSEQMLSLSSSTPGVWIRYTTDGSVPSPTAGTLYHRRVPVAASATFRAIAYAKGMTPSAVISATYTISPTIKAPAGVAKDKDDLKDQQDD